MVAIASGLWWDYSKSHVLAPTLTLPVNSGSILISGLTLLVTFAGASFWSITAFVLHHWKAKGETTGTLDLQYEVSLRNSTGAIRTLWEVIKIHQAWSKKRPKPPLLQTFTVAVPAILISVGFAAASLLTSTVANKTYGAAIARVQPNDCGFWIFDDTTDGMMDMSRKIVNDTIQARNYAATFYANSSGSTVRPMFVQSTLPYSIDDSAPCPIPAAERCILGHDKAFRVTSAFLDSHEMLGINAKPNDRISVQLSLTCSPVQVDDLYNTPGSGDSRAREYYLGGYSGNSSAPTYIYRPSIGYYIRSVFAYAETLKLRNNSPWKPIPDFNRTDADVSVHFLSQNDILYMGPVHDPWFSANGTSNLTSDGLLGIKADAAVNTMVCADQYVLCNPSKSVCNSPAGLYTHYEDVWVTNILEFNAAQLATAGRILVAFAYANTFGTVSSLGPTALWANTLTGGISSPSLPDNQWQIEVLGWFQTNLARIQGSVVEFASNTAGISPFGSIGIQNGQRLGDPPSSAEGRAQLDQCANQLVQAVGEVQNFSLCGVLVIVCLSAAVVLLDWSLEWMVDFFGHRDSVPKRARQADGKLHLLRMALRGSTTGGDDWELGKWGIPVRVDLGPIDRPTISKNLVVYAESG